MAYKSSARGSRPVRLLGIHTAEGARTARNLAAYFYRPEVQASSHDIIDATETLHIVDYDRAAWTMRSANPISDNVELCAFAKWTRAQWLSTDTVDGCRSPRAILDRTAEWIARRCQARRIPVDKLTLVELRSGYWGVIAHDDWSKGMNDGTHWDPGPGFPWDYVMSQAASHTTTAAVGRVADEEDEDAMQQYEFTGGPGWKREQIPVADNGKQPVITLAVGVDGEFAAFAWVAPKGGNGWSEKGQLLDKGATVLKPTKGTDKVDLQFKCRGSVRAVVHYI